MNTAVKRAPNGYRIGDSHHRHEFTDHEIELARQLRADGMTLRKLADKFEASVSHMSRVCGFKRRQHSR